MASIFGSKKNTSKKDVTLEEKKEESTVSSVSKSNKVTSSSDGLIAQVLRNKSILVRPRITEKATDMQMDNNVYTFDVVTDANKIEVNNAIKILYGVTPLKTRVVTIPSKVVRTRKGGKGVKSGGKKAYVYLKKGDSIEFV